MRPLTRNLLQIRPYLLAPIILCDSQKRYQMRSYKCLELRSVTIFTEIIMSPHNPRKILFKAVLRTGRTLRNACSDFFYGGLDNASPHLGKGHEAFCLRKRQSPRVIVNEKTIGRPIFAA